MGPKPMSEFVRRKLDLFNIEQRTPAWYTAREGRLTASDAAACLGVNQYCSPTQLIKRKLGPRTFFANKATEWGQKYESEAIARYERLTGNYVHECGLFMHPKYSFLGGSPDGLVDTSASLEHGTPHTAKLIEVKCPYFKDCQPSCPDIYYPQIQVCLEVLDIEACDLVQYIPASTFTAEKIVIITVPRNRSWFDQQLPIMRAWYDRMLEQRNQPPPPPNSPESDTPSPPSKKQRTRKVKPYMLLDYTDSPCPCAALK